jgi:hypothetical protein
MSTGLKNMDITRTLISSDYVHSHLTSLFPESIFLDLDFKIMGVSQQVLRSLGFTGDELQGEEISIIDGTGTFENILREQLNNGFFAELKIKLKPKEGEPIPFCLSGFYLGLISDMSGVIVLKLCNQQEISMLDQQLQLTKAQLDNFIYRTAHDIRGPLATVQGLINLIKMRKDDSEIERFTDLIDAHTKKLDECLARLIYVAQVDDEESEPLHIVNFGDLETHIRKVIEQNAFLDFLELNFSSFRESINGVNEILLRKLVTNLILYILSLTKNTTNTKISICCKCSALTLTIEIKSVGFIADNMDTNNINEAAASMYTDLLTHSKRTHIFAAQKIAAKLKASINIDFPSTQNQRLIISVPLVNRLKI